MKPHGLISEAPPEKLTFERAVFSRTPTGVCMSDASAPIPFYIARKITKWERKTCRSGQT